MSVPQCRLVPTKTAVYRTVKECQRCESYEELVVSTQYEKTCQRLQTQKCETEFQEVSLQDEISVPCCDFDVLGTWDLMLDL